MWDREKDSERASESVRVQGRLRWVLGKGGYLSKI